MNKSANLPTPISFQRNICRTCLKKISASSSVEIFSDKPFYKGRTLSHIFFEMTNKLMDPREKLPTNICLGCAYRLKGTAAFKRSIDKADDILRGKLRLAQRRHYMKNAESVDAALDALCNDLVEIPDESEQSSTETTKPTVTRKPVDTEKLKAWQINIENMMRKKPFIVSKNKSPEKIITKTADLKKVTLQPVVNQNADNNNKAENIEQLGSNMDSSDQNCKDKKKTMYKEKECDGKAINNPVLEKSLHQPVLASEENRKENLQMADTVIIHEIVQSTINDTVILIGETESAAQTATTFNSPQNQPIIIEIVDEEETVNAGNSQNFEKKKSSLDLEDCKQEKENLSPEGKKSTTQDSLAALASNSGHKRVAKDGSNSQKQTSLDNSNALSRNFNIAEADSEKPLACHKCDKRFTNQDYLERHLEYHSLKLEPNDETDSSDEYHCVKSISVAAVYEKARKICEGLKKGTGKPPKKPVVHRVTNSKNHLFVPTPCRSGEELKNIESSCQDIYETILSNPNVKQIVETKSNRMENQVLPLQSVFAECKYCKKMIHEFELRKHILREHRELHLKERRTRFKCSICQKGYKSKNLMLAHMKSHEARWKCNHCDKTFTQNSALSRHLLTSHGIKRTFLCYVCGKTVSYNSTWTHIKSHKPSSKTFKCTVEGCTAILKYKYSLENHIKRFHEGEKPFICEHCGKLFAVRNSLKQHLRTHTRSVRYTCDICGRNFSLKSCFKQHRLTHQYSKPHTCPVCPQRFGYKYSIRKHCARYHPEHPLALKYTHRIYSTAPRIEKLFNCLLCQRKFASQFNLNKHNKTFHPFLHLNIKGTRIDSSDAMKKSIF